MLTHEKIKPYNMHKLHIFLIFSFALFVQTSFIELMINNLKTIAIWEIYTMNKLTLPYKYK